MTVERFLTGKPETIRKLNLLVDAVKSLQNLNGDIFIRTANTSAGTTIRLNIAAVLERIMKNTGGGNDVRRAFVKTTPGATTSVDVYLYEDASNTEVTVECYIYGGGNLEDAFPTLTDGMPFYVQYDPAAGEWKNVTSIYKIGLDCNG